VSGRTAIVTDGAPTPTGPFSQAIRHGSIIVTAGQAGRNRDTGTMGDLEEQTTWALRNIAAILEAGGATLADVAKVTLFVKEGQSTEGLNRAYTAAFSEPLPARTLVFVSRLKGDDMLVELEALAVVD
jgi:2-iminobutanoate/2-iminopropanoate deaminase